jgi:hypothetical protein
MGGANDYFGRDFCYDPNFNEPSVCSACNDGYFV